MAKTYKCIICLDSGWFAVDPDNTDDIIPLAGASGEDINHRRLRRCQCGMQNNSGKGENNEQKTKEKDGGRYGWGK